MSTGGVHPAAGTTLQGGEHEGTPTPIFLLGLLLLFANIFNDAGLGVVQAQAFSVHGKHIDESVAMMSGLGSMFMVAIGGTEARHFLTSWVTTPTWRPITSMLILPGGLREPLMPTLGSPTDGVIGDDRFFIVPEVPIELALLMLNFVGNWNAKKICTWLNGTVGAIVSSLVPMIYRLLATVISAVLTGSSQPAYTWYGVGMVFGGSFIYLFSPSTITRSKMDPHKADDDTLSAEFSLSHGTCNGMKGQSEHSILSQGVGGSSVSYHHNGSSVVRRVGHDSSFGLDTSPMTRPYNSPAYTPAMLTPLNVVLPDPHGTGVQVSPVLAAVTPTTEVTYLLTPSLTLPAASR